MVFKQLIFQVGSSIFALTGIVIMNLEPSPSVLLTVISHPMSLNDSIADRKAQAGAFYFSLGCEEGGKKFFHIFLLYSMPAIFNLHFNDGIKSSGANGERSTPRACLIGVLQKV